MINTVVYSTVLKGFAVSKRIDKVLAVYKARTGLLELSLSFCTPI
jgi:pentatricopeptide repeat protein